MALHQQPCILCDRMALCRGGDYPPLIAELDTGFAVLGESQFFLGYSVFIAKDPIVELHDLAPPRRLRLLEEVAQLAEAVALVTAPHKLNYECLGNIVPHMHWHIFPRRLSDPDPRAPVWNQIPTGSAATLHEYDPKTHAHMQDAVRARLHRLRAET